MSLYPAPQAPWPTPSGHIAKLRNPYSPNPDQLRETPQLAVLAALSATLRQASSALVAWDAELDRGPLDGSAYPHSVSRHLLLASTVVALISALDSALDCYCYALVNQDGDDDEQEIPF
jgi:hypothetical protein